MTRYSFKDAANGAACALTIPLGAPGMPGALTVAACGDNRADALAKAAALAERIASDPILAALLPPQAVAALAAAKQLGAAARAGRRTLRAVWRGIRGPGKARLVKALTVDDPKQEDGAILGASSIYERLARKYGPAAARKLARALKRKRKRKARREAAPPPEQPEDEQPEDEQPEDGQEDGGADDVSGGDWIDPASYGGES